MDRGHRDADRDLKQLEKRLKKEYGQAYDEMSKKTNAWLKKFDAQDKEKRALVKDGTMSKTEYVKWRKRAMMTTDQMNGICADLSHTLTDYNVVATSMVNSHARSIFAENYNYGAYEVCKDADVKFAFNLVDERTVTRLVRDNPKLLPKASVDISKDLRWNEQKIRSALTQGILQGEPIDKIAKRLQQVTDMSDSASVRNARTMTTGAENGGRMAVYEDAQEMGIDIQKTWLATLDNRTRDEHAELDGVTIPIDEPFRNSIGEIMFPADPDCEDGDNVYNCRCTLICRVNKNKVDFSRRQMSEKMGNISYDEWKAEAHQRAEERAERRKNRK